MTAPKAAPPKGKAAHTSSTSKRIPKPVPTSPKGLEATRGEQDLERRGNPSGWPVVEILWVDAISGGLWDWLDPTQLADMHPEDSRVVGYLASETDDYITVASLINDGSVAHALCIPTSLIIEMRRLHP